MCSWIVHDILRFEIPVTDIFTVHKGDCLQHLMEDDCHGWLSHKFLWSVVKDWPLQVNLLSLCVYPRSHGSWGKGELSQVIFQKKLLDVTVQHLPLYKLQNDV